MNIIEIILDSFKSYSEKTHITQLDKNFNAITGLNGSGKSNILDAICFILGINSTFMIESFNNIFKTYLIIIKIEIKL
jgi:structural maintenance of chromosome 2